MLAHDAPRAAAIAAAAEFLGYLTRDLDALPAAPRRFERGVRHTGIVRSSGARRRQEEGLVAEVLPHEVPTGSSTASWTCVPLTRWKRGDGNARQGLELDVVGMTWGEDLAREAASWATRRFAGTRWQAERSKTYDVLNTYRVMLARAQAKTVIWVPRGNVRTDVFPIRRTLPRK